VGAILVELWRKMFRILDDVKESVVLAGMELAKVAMQLTSRLCHAEEEGAVEVLGEVLPLLLQTGLVDRSKEVQAVAIMTLVKLVKGR